MADVVITFSGSCCCFCAGGIPITTALTQCRTRGGTAEICGYDEWADPSTPPKRYRKKTVSGRNEYLVYDDAAATIPTTQVRFILTGGTVVILSGVFPGSGYNRTCTFTVSLRRAAGVDEVRVEMDMAAAVNTGGFGSGPYGSAAVTQVDSGGTATGPGLLYQTFSTSAAYFDTGWGPLVSSTRGLNLGFGIGNGGGGITDFKEEIFELNVATVHLREIFDYDGEFTVDQATCDESVTGEVTIRHWDESPDDTDTLPGTLAGICGYDVVATDTTQTLTVNSTVCGPGYGGKYFKADIAGAQIVLTVEDTEADAIARLLAGPGGTWSAWTTVGNGVFPTCLPTDCCKAHYYDRTPIFAFAYQESEWRLKTEDQPIDPGCYSARVSYYVRPAGSDETWQEFEDHIIDLVVIGVTGTGTMFILVGGEYQILDKLAIYPPIEGLETYIGNLRLCSTACPDEIEP